LPCYFINKKKELIVKLKSKKKKTMDYLTYCELKLKERLVLMKDFFVGPDIVYKANKN